MVAALERISLLIAIVILEEHHILQRKIQYFKQASKKQSA